MSKVDHQNKYTVQMKPKANTVHRPTENNDFMFYAKFVTLKKLH